MRIIAGLAKGTRLARVPGRTRPLSDRAREGLFSSLGGRVEGARWADLFAGTGAVGIEALSRGAASCDFVDSGAGAIQAIRKNLSLSGLESRARVTRTDVRRFLEGPRGPYDVVFLDPPYAYPEARLAAVLEATPATLATGATIVITRPSRDATAGIPVDLQVTKHLTYGDTHILVLEGR